MKFSTCWLSLLLGLAAMGCSSGSSDGGKWGRLLPVDSDGSYGYGVSAPFIGTLPDGRAVVAGGCNFPEVPAAEGGTKRYYDDIYVWDTVAEAWRSGGRLPQALAYGACASTPEGIFCAGGTDSLGRSTNEAYLLTSDGLKTLASLPEPLDNCAGVYLEGRCYVVGGRSFYVYDFQSNAWQAGPLWPGTERRVQPVVVAQAGRVWLFGGYDPEGAEFVASEGYVYDPATETWRTIAGPVDAEGEPLLAAGGAGVAWGADSIVCFGGVNGVVFTEALDRAWTLAVAPENDSLRRVQRAYMEQEPGWYRFNDRVLIFDTAAERWSVSSERAPQGARAGAGATPMRWGTSPGVLLFNGELKPGIRTPEVWLWRP
ncbi:kelch repeat-containing protein [uncultured Rikenella sp.]|uniref:kelch repeat-containing protein n=1 Tax=uncultured Rikenella sp. TaxID=368003 RepID=UPI0026311DDA|nr:kelch repeat-containing protein [uncultured Rikenella sp.]